MLDLHMTGKGQLADIAERCRKASAAGDKSVRREVGKALRVATEPAKDSIRRAALAQLPRRGGLAADIARSRITTQLSLRGGNPSVRITGRWSGHSIRAIDRGRLRHPVFGHADRWATQSVQPGFFTETLNRERVRNRRAVIFAIEDVSRMVAGG